MITNSEFALEHSHRAPRIRSANGLPWAGAWEATSPCSAAVSEASSLGSATHTRRSHRVLMRFDPTHFARYRSRYSCSLGDRPGSSRLATRRGCPRGFSAATADPAQWIHGNSAPSGYTADVPRVRKHEDQSKWFGVLVRRQDSPRCQRRHLFNATWHTSC